MTVGEVGPESASPRAPWTSAITAPVMDTAPIQSKRRRTPREPSGSTRRAIATPATETGTVTRNTDDHPKAPTRTPPAITPAAPPSAEAAPQMLIAFARCSPV